MTRVIVTVGPSSETPAAAGELIELGANSFRFPASKFPASVLAQQATMIADLAREAGRPVDLLVDLPGSKSRLSNDSGFELAGVDRLRVNYTATPAVRDRSLPVLGITGADLSSVIAPGDTLVLGDGEDALRVETVAGDHCIARPLTTGELGRRRGITVQGKRQAHESLTETDMQAMREVPSTDFAGAIVSFVEDAATLERARAAMPDSDVRRPVVIAKIETRAGAEAAAEIADAADAVLLGRGDLLMECGELDFYDLGKTVIKTCQQKGVPIIVGTQLLPSLSTSWLPNRSELAYVSHLIEKEVDGLMLSFETTIGRSPNRTVSLLKELIARYGKPAEGPLFPTRARALEALEDK